MSRNKFILMMGLLVILYFVLPDNGVGLIIKANMIAVAPYIMLFIIIYLVITINMLKRSLKKLSAKMNDENVIGAAKMMNITFDVKRMMGAENLQLLYNQVNFSSDLSLYAKTLFYNALRKKRLDVPPPSEGKHRQSVHL